MLLKMQNRFFFCEKVFFSSISIFVFNTCSSQSLVHQMLPFSICSKILCYVLAIGLIVFVKQLRQLHHVFFVNLALCDFGVMVMDVFVLLGAIYGRDFYLERPMLCEISGFICMMSCFGSLWTMMFIAINRLNFYTEPCMKISHG